MMRILPAAQAFHANQVAGRKAQQRLTRQLGLGQSTDGLEPAEDPLDALAQFHKSKWVKYEIEQSIARGNGLLTIDVSKIADMQGHTTGCCSLPVTGYRQYFWNKENGRENLGDWVDAAAKTAGK